MSLRNSRQEKLAPSELLNAAKAVVIGAGAVGHQVATSLASMGVSQIHIIDFDAVGEENLAPQRFAESEVGKNKAQSVAEECVLLNSHIVVKAIRRKLLSKDKSLFRGAYVFSCVDNIEVRREIFDMCVDAEAEWFGDTRSATEFTEVYSCPKPADVSTGSQKYLNTLFSAQEAYQATCSTKMTNYIAGNAAALVMAKFAQVLRGANQEYSAHSCNLLSFEMENL